MHRAFAHKLMAVRQLLETRRRHGKGFSGTKRQKSSSSNLSAQDVIKAYKREVDRKRLLARKADAVNTRLLFIVEAMRCLRQEDHFMTLLRAEGLETIAASPYLCSAIKALESVLALIRKSSKSLEALLHRKNQSSVDLYMVRD
jgi:hypothetical protein